MILDKEDTLKTGICFKFSTTPAYLTNSFRGKYTVVFYKINVAIITNEKDWVSEEIVYVYFENDQNRFVRIKSVSKEKQQNKK